MSHKITQEIFNTRSSIAHDGIYVYTKAVYNDRLTPVEIYCTKHDHTFHQPAGQHMDGKTSCHQCILEKKMQSRIAKRVGKFPPMHKQCGTCEEILPYTEFIPNEAGIDGLYSVFRKCCSLRNKAQRKCPEYMKRLKEVSLIYTRRNKDKLNVRSARRRAARVQATVDFGDKEYEDFFMQEIYNLAVIREAATGVKWEVDHMAPLISDLVCGLHWSGNLQLLMASDNRSKSNTYWPDMW